MRNSNFAQKFVKFSAFVFAVACVVLAVTLTLQEKTSADTTYFLLTPNDPLIQQWSDTGLITTDDDWSGVPSIIGYRGDGLASSAGTDPQTITADGSLTPIDVNANEPSTGLATGGIAEFDSLVNPVVAMQGSGTADAPHLDIRINTGKCDAPNDVRVAYVLRDVDTSGDTNQQVALQYRVGSTGAYTNVGSAYVADATDSSDTLETPVSAILPSAVLGQSAVHIRIMTTDAPSVDEFVGIDDLVVSCLTPTGGEGSIRGRVVDAFGYGIPHVSMIVSGGTLSESRTVRTNNFGYYQFERLDIGESYVLQPFSGRYQFDNASMVINLDSDFLNANFLGTPIGSSERPARGQQKIRSIPGRKSP
ncbi:MAG: carboxypeptidase-like regulatory domain-containing protein [Pyrinomonadaceae bacterium]